MEAHGSDTMAQPLLPGSTADEDGARAEDPDPGKSADMAELKIFWGPEICRLEYLVHLLETGRVKHDLALTA